MDKPLQEVLNVDTAWWRALGSAVIRAIKELTDGGEGVDGKFPAYTPDYRERKSTGHPKIRRQADFSSSPNLRLTGDMMNDLQQTEVSGDGVTIGWPSQGGKMKYNAEMGRAISTKEKPLAPSVALMVEKRYKQEIDRRLADARFDRSVILGK